MIPLFDKKQISSSSLGALKLVPLGYVKMLSMILVSRIHKSSYLQLCCRGIEWASLKSFMSYSYPKPGASGLVKNEIFLLDIPSGRLCSLVCVLIVTHWILHVGGNIALSVAILRKWTVSSIEKNKYMFFFFTSLKDQKAPSGGNYLVNNSFFVKSWNPYIVLQVELQRWDPTVIRRPQSRCWGSHTSSRTLNTAP